MTSPTAPTLETPRLRLRGFRASDLDAQWATMTDPEVYRHLGGVPATREETWRKILGSPGLWALLGYGYWVAERREDGAYLGQIGFADFKRDMSPSIEGIPEMGWIMAREAQGRGYATEAILAAFAWADGALGGARSSPSSATKTPPRSGSPRKAASPAARKRCTKASRSSSSAVPAR